MKLKIAAGIFLFIAVTTIGLIGYKINFSTQWPIFESLRSTSAIIFGVVGAWMALVYPRAVRFIARNRNSDNVTKMAEIEDAEVLLKPLIWSSVVLITLVLLGPISEILKHLNLPTQVNEIARSLSFILLVSLSIIQVLAVIQTLRPIQKIKNDFRKFKREKKALKKFSTK
jgi:hypothetical protein